jgi:hypothetical protein
MVSGLAGLAVSVVSRAISASRVDAPGSRDERLRLTLDHERPSEQRLTSGDWNRFALAGEWRSVVEGPVGEHGRGIGRDPVTGFEHDQVAGHHLAGVDVDPTAVAAHRDQARKQCPEPLSGTVSATLLGEGEHRVQHDHPEDRDPQLRADQQQSPTPPATHNITAKKCSNWSPNRFNADGRRGGGNSLGPSRARRAAASTVLSPTEPAPRASDTVAWSSGQPHAWGNSCGSIATTTSARSGWS